MHSLRRLPVELQQAPQTPWGALQHRFSRRGGRAAFGGELNGDRNKPKGHLTGMHRIRGIKSKKALISIYPLHPLHPCKLGFAL
jgi:hypothetical protein